MLHRIDGRASYFSPDIFIEHCKDTKKFCILAIFLRFLIKKPPICKWISGYGSVINFLCYTKIYGKAEKMTSDRTAKGCR